MPALALEEHARGDDKDDSRRARVLGAAVQAGGHEQQDPCHEVVERGVPAGQGAKAREEAGAHDEGPTGAVSAAAPPCAVCMQREGDGLVSRDGQLAVQ